MAEAVAKETGVTVPYQVGTMIELPRAALRAGEIAESAEFFSFGTNDLTQTTLGVSRDDAASFLGSYTSKGLLPADPFVTLDQEGVGELVKHRRRARPGDAPGHQARHLRRARRRSRQHRLLRDRAARLRLVLAVPRADRPPRRGAGGARQARGGADGVRRLSPAGRRSAKLARVAERGAALVASHETLEGGEVVAPRLAATVLLVRDGPDGLQVFMVVRHQQIEFASGALVFPGGKVEPEDLALAGGDDEKAARVAAIRETYEECGVLLAAPAAAALRRCRSTSGSQAEVWRRRSTR